MASRALKLFHKWHKEQPLYFKTLCSFVFLREILCKFFTQNNPRETGLEYDFFLSLTEYTP